MFRGSDLTNCWRGLGAVVVIICIVLVGVGGLIGYVAGHHVGYDEGVVKERERIVEATKGIFRIIPLKPIPTRPIIKDTEAGRDKD